LSLFFYPINFIVSDFIHYKKAKEICSKLKFDLVISQCYPEQSVISSVLLKRKGYIENLMVIFWDNLYGKLSSKRLLHLSLLRQKIVESYIAKYSNTIISLYPIKDFHEKYGEVKNAIGKRFYLGIPSVLHPTAPIETRHKSVIIEDKINVLYSGTIINKKDLLYLVSLFNKSRYAKKINLVFFSQGLDNEVFVELQNSFVGTINNYGYIPVKELHSIYYDVDVFLSLTGNPKAIRSKCYEYMSFGHPMMFLFDDESDVNISTFSNYPLRLVIDIRSAFDVNVEVLDKFLSGSIGKRVPFDYVESIYKLDSASAYVDLISRRF
jgi:glycosyltransferase involved in cell wall biosynthesis